MLADVRGLCRSRRAGGAALPLLLFTDERGKEYLRPLLSGLRSLRAVSAVHHVDPLLQSQFPGDNYAVFLAETELANCAERQLELARSACPDCSPEASSRAMCVGMANAPPGLPSGQRLHVDHSAEQMPRREV